MTAKQADGTLVEINSHTQKSRQVYICDKERDGGWNMQIH